MISGALRAAAPWLMIDFREVVYYPTRAFLDGLNPYNILEYVERYPVHLAVSPYARAVFLLFAPIGLLPLGVSGAAMDWPCLDCSRCI